TEPSWKTVTGFTLFPGPDTIVTLALWPDVLISPRYRQRYFVCEAGPEEVLGVLACPEPHRSRWMELVSLQPPGYWRDFMGGPGSWLLSRLVRIEQVVAWSDRGLAWDDLDCRTHRGWGMVVPAEGAPFFAPSAGPEAKNG